jgi:putative ABC transport system permease protein
VNGYRVTPSYFRVLQARPALGRAFTDADARYTESPDVVMLSDGLWRRRFGADTAVIGRVVELNSVPRTIVGVMPPGFVFPAGAELWTPLSVDGVFGRERDGRALSGVLARLRPGVSLAKARADVHGIMLQLQQEYPAEDARWDMRVEPADEFYGQHPRPFMLAQLVAVALVLLIACANVANLLLARAATGSREIAVRVALGATRMRIVRRQLAESLILALAGGALGTFVAVWGVVAVRAMLTPALATASPGWSRMEVSGAVLAFAAAVSLGTAVLVGVVPALVASGADPQSALADGGRSASEGRGRHRLRGLLVSAELALALMLLAGTVATVRGFEALAHRPPGYSLEHALTMQLTAPFAVYGSQADAEAMYARVLARVRAEPGVENAAYTTVLPPEPSDYHARIFLEGEPRPARSDPARAPRWRMVTPTYFATMGIPLMSGRVFTEHDDSTSRRVVVVSETMARDYWPGQSPIGERIGSAGTDTTMATVIGVVGDVHDNPNLGGPETAPEYYIATGQAHPWRTMSLVVRTGTDPAGLTRRVEQAIYSVAPAMAPGSVQTLERLYASSLSPQRITSEMMAAFAVVALILAGFGVYSVMSYSVAQQTHDIGVRTALGALPSDILRVVLGGASRLVATGIVAGIAGALLMTRALAHLLTQLAPGDPTAFGAAIVTLIAAAAVGSYWPARRAMRVDPAVALRRDV